jgi:putative FmdB family regulatory protein
MPVYEFFCKKCKEGFQKSYPINEAVAYPECPTCGNQMVRLYNFGSVTFKGSGFYRTDK